MCFTGLKAPGLGWGCYVLGCGDGPAVSIPNRHGYTGLLNMLGGITAWETLGLPLEKPDGVQKAA
jgi:hypothetical protein